MLDVTECPQCNKPISRKGLNAHIKRMHAPKPAVDEAIAIHLPVCDKRVPDDVEEQEPTKVLSECVISPAMCQFSFSPDEVHATKSTEYSDIARSIIDDMLDKICVEMDQSSEIVSIANSNPIIVCGQCNDSVTADSCDIVCSKCKSGPVYNNVTIEQQYVACTKLDQPVWDFRPIIDQGRVSIYAPTAQNIRNTLKVDTLKYYTLNGVRDISIKQYKASVQAINSAYIHKEIKNVRESIYAAEDIERMSYEDLEALYQQNPYISSGKDFQMKLMLDYAPKYDCNAPRITIYLDTETSCCDNQYADVPKPSNRAHRLTIIQFLYDDGQNKPTQYIYHQKGYQYDREVLQADFSDVTLVFCEYSSEKQMVDAFWNFILKIRSMIILTGFNAVHSILYQERSAEAHSDASRKQFCGYDLQWLTARSSYAFTAINSQIKLNSSTNAMLSQVREIPNMICIDYQALCIQPILGSDNQKIEGYGLKSLLSFIHKNDDSVCKIMKIDQNIHRLQRVTHQQLSLCVEREDLTNEMRYSINDTVCLWRSNRVMQYLENSTTIIQEFFLAPISAAVSFTTSRFSQLLISRMLLEQGKPYKICAKEEKQVIRVSGAYTNNEQSYQRSISTFIRQDDFNSLYPSVILSYNISFETLVGIFPLNEVQDKYMDKQKYAIIEISDDAAFCHEKNRSYAVYTREFEGMLYKLARMYTDRRANYKKQMEQAESTSERMRFNQMQNQAKICNNAVYGSSGSIFNAYYNRTVAASITAGARHALQQLNRSIHEIVGFRGEQQHIFDENQPVMIRDPIRGTWNRYMYNSAPNMQSRIIQNDTDSAFQVHNDTKWVSDALQDHENAEQHWMWFEKALFSKLATYLPSTLKVAAEEFIYAQVTSCAKKSYARVEFSAAGWKNGFARISNQIQADPNIMYDLIENGTMKLVIKGVAWSSACQDMNQHIRDMFIDILATQKIDESIEKRRTILLNALEHGLRDFSATKSTEGLMLFSKRVKMSGRANNVRFLRERYSINLEEHPFVYALPLLAISRGQKRSELWIPIQNLNDKTIRMLDKERMLDAFEQCVKKFFVNKQQTIDDDDKPKKTTQKRIQLSEIITPDQVMIRLETARNKQFDTRLIEVDEVQSFIAANPQYTVHEVIYNNINKLYFDIDKTELDVYKFKKDIQRILVRANITLEQELRLTVAQHEKDCELEPSYHITANVCVPLEVNRFICVQLMNMGHQGLDQQVYAIMKTLRCASSHKLDAKGVARKETILHHDGHHFHEALVTYTEGLQIVNIPPCLKKEPIIAFDHLESSPDISNLQIPEQLVSALNVLVYSNQKTHFGDKIYSLKHGAVCPACGKTGDHEKKITVRQTVKQYKIMCKRTRTDGQVAELVIPLTEEQRKAIKTFFANRAIDTSVRYQDNCIMYENAQYVDFKFNGPLTFVKSAMGSGKTECLIRELKPILAKSSGLMLSCRQSLTSEWIGRYQRAGIQTIDYRNIENGQIRCDDGQLIVVQVDSLTRVQSDNIGILILDELQSIIAQLNSSQLRDKTAILRTFISLCESANQVVCLDANLHDSTADLIEYICEMTGSRKIVNRYAKYADYNVTLQKFNKQKTDAIFEQYKRELINQDGSYSGRRVIGHINSLTLLLSLEAYIKSLSPEIRIQTYTGDDSRKTREQRDREEQDLKNVYESWLQYDVVLYSGTISSGIDFQPQHFDVNISVFSHSANTPDQFMQGLMRARNIKDKQLYVFIQNTNYQSAVSCESTYRTYVNNMAHFNVSSSQITDKLFNLAIYIEAYSVQQQRRPQDIIVATLNQMGCQLRYQHSETQTATIGKQFKPETLKITANLLQSTTKIEPEAISLYLQRDDRQSFQEAYINSSPEIRQQFSIISFLCTARHNQFNFNVHQQFADQVDKVLHEIQQNDSQQLISEYECYQSYKSTYRVLDVHPHTLSTEELHKQLRQIVQIHDNQFVRGQRVKAWEQRDINISKIAREIEDAHNFVTLYQTKVAPDQQDAHKAEIVKLAKQCGYSEQKYKYIFAKVGLFFSRDVIRRRENGKIVRAYTDIVRPFFSE